MSEQIDSVAETYAEELAKDSDVLDKDDFLSKFEFEELQEKHDSLETSGPAPNSGDPGAGFQSPEDPDEDPEEAELDEKEELAASSFEDRAKKTGKKYWAEFAQEMKEEAAE